MTTQRYLRIKETSRIPMSKGKKASKYKIYKWLCYLVIIAAPIPFLLWFKPTLRMDMKDKNTLYLLHWINRKDGHNLNLPYQFEGMDKNYEVSHDIWATHKMFFTKDESYLEYVESYDAIIFHGVHIPNYDIYPKSRSAKQIYILASLPILYDDTRRLAEFDLNNIFNITWTFKLNSDVLYHHVVIRDNNGTLIGPRQSMHWVDGDALRKSALDDTIKSKLKNKKKAAALFLSNCFSHNGRDTTLFYFQRELKKYNLSIDIYGECGDLKCAKDKMNECLEMLERDYYFYLAFERFHAEDFVTGILLHALKHYAIPIVFGGANYTRFILQQYNWIYVKSMVVNRFMPDGVYLNIRKLGLQKLAQLMYELIQDPERYYQYFKWHNFYSYHRPNESPETDPYCQLHKKLTEMIVEKDKAKSVNFDVWWGRYYVNLKPEKRYKPDNFIY